MSVTIQLGTTILCEKAGGREKNKLIGLSDAVIESPQSMQIATAIRAANVKVYDRLNRQFKLTYGASIECDSAVTAFIWEIEFHANCVRSGTLSITVKDDATGYTRKYTVADCGLENIKTTQTGATVRIAYTLTGGRLTNDTTRS